MRWSMIACAVLFSLFPAGAMFNHKQFRAFEQSGGDVSQGERLPQVNPAVGPGTGETSDVADHFGPKILKRGKEYRTTKYIVFFLRMGVSLLFLCVIVRLQAASWAVQHFGPFVHGRGWLTAGILAALLTVAMSLVTLPINFYSGYIHEHSFGLSTRALPGWFLDLGKYVMIQVLLSFVIFTGLYLLMCVFPKWWWIASGVLFSVFMIAVTTLSPLVIDPLFNTFTPLDNERIAREVIDLSRKAGVEVDKVYEMNASLRTRKLNAYVTGMGKTKRVVLYDTLLKKSTPEEVKMVVAHELGHWRRNHLWKGVLLAAAGTFIIVFVLSKVLTGQFAKGVGVSSFSDPAGVPLIMLIVMLLGFLSMPIQNVISRHFERQADLDSLVLTGDPDTFIRAEEKMGRINLNDVDPNPVIKWILFTHPSTIERIRMAEEYERRITGPGEHAEENL